MGLILLIDQTAQTGPLITQPLVDSPSAVFQAIKTADVFLPGETVVTSRQEIGGAGQRVQTGMTH